ncbi:hypothetical protein RRG08_062464 [Elysia crispata]|uniref:Uncharacterized protein n=1 Tax=Elysia crispata TaxID=231223 RepID=A0AAE1CJE4_9GAST|nr:hypothetical protein RRG08_062464 [Elysia crispata]
MRYEFGGCSANERSPDDGFNSRYPSINQHRNWRWVDNRSSTTKEITGEAHPSCCLSDYRTDDLIGPPDTQ